MGGDVQHEGRCKMLHGLLGIGFKNFIAISGIREEEEKKGTKEGIYQILSTITHSGHFNPDLGTFLFVIYHLLNTRRGRWRERR